MPKSTLPINPTETQTMEVIHKYDSAEIEELQRKAALWDRVKEIASSDYCSRCFNRFKCPSDDYAPCPFKDILEEVEGEEIEVKG